MKEITVYDITDLERVPAGKTDEIMMLQPYWIQKLNLSSHPKYSTPFFDSHGTRLTVIMDGVVYGFTIPYDIGKSPQFQLISDVNVSDTWWTCSGISKMYAHDTNKGVIRMLNFVWSGDEDVARDMSSLLPAVTHSSQRRCHIHFEWEDAPFFDESSNRILSFTNTHWVVLDFAYK